MGPSTLQHKTSAKHPLVHGDDQSDKDRDHLSSQKSNTFCCTSREGEMYFM